MFDRQQTTSCFRGLVVIVYIVTVFSMAVLWCFPEMTPLGPFIPRPKERESTLFFCGPLQQAVNGSLRLC